MNLIVFMGDTYYPLGGANDIQETFDNYDDAVSYIKNTFKEGDYN